MKIKTVRTLITLLLCSALLCAFCASASADETTTDGLVDPARLDELTQELLSEHGVNAENVSIGYCYLATGDTWYYNNDLWLYAASVYKVPLMMLMAEKVSGGELTQDTVINGITLAETERLVLTYSNNDYARNLRFNYFEGDAAWGALAQKYSDMAPGEYDANYIEYRYYNPRYIVDVLKTLYTDGERFPNVIDCLLNAEPGDYFRSTLEGKYDIAQKYGAFEENNGTKNNHTVGIIYTPNPIIVSVMTKNVGAYESFIGDAAQMLVDYTLTLDTELAAYEKQQEDAAAEEQRVADEAERKATEEEQQKAEQEAQRLAEAQKKVEQDSKKAAVKKWALIGAAVLAVIAVAAVLLRAWKRRSRLSEAQKRTKQAEKQRVYEERATRTPRVYEERTTRKPREKTGEYTPKH